MPYAAELMVGSVVISSDYFKTFIGALMNLVGGRITVYEPLLERGRREAVLRLQEAAMAWGATHVVNLRIETSELGSGNSGSNGIVALGNNGLRHGAEVDLQEMRPQGKP